MSEETKRANVAGPWGMVSAIVGSSCLGWIFIISLLTGVHDYDTTVSTSTGFAVTQILLDNFGRRWTLLLMLCLLLACWLCGLLTVTSNSRMIYAFSRDRAMVTDRILHSLISHGRSFSSRGVVCGTKSIIVFRVR
jgi:amino acid transporter